MLDSKEVLVVEDHPVNRTLLSSILTIMNLTHDLAENGEDALQKINSVRYQLILMDIFMPVMDGIECLQKIRTHKESLVAQVPVIAITAKPETKGLDLFSEVIPKPIDLDKLKHYINLYLEK